MLLTKEGCKIKIKLLITVAIVILVVITTFLTTPAAAQYRQDGIRQELKDRIDKLKQSLRSSIAKDAVMKAYSQLSSPRSPDRNDVLHFFCDMKAKDVLHTVLSTRSRAKHIGFAKTDLRFLSELFQTGDDVLAVCEAMLENAEGLYLESGGTEGEMARRRFLTEIGKLLAELSGVEFESFKKFEQNDLRTWIVATLKKGWESAESNDKKRMLQPSLKFLDPNGDYKIKQEKTAPPGNEKLEKIEKKTEPVEKAFPWYLVAIIEAVIIAALALIVIKRGRK